MNFFHSSPLSNDKDFLKLISENIGLLCTRDDQGNFPLHFYVGVFPFPVQDETLSFLLNNAPNVIQHRGRFGRLPLHYALCRKKDIDTKVLVRLLDLYPEATTVLTNGGWIPLHYAVDRDLALFDVVKLLCSYNPMSTFIEDFEHKLAIHWAIDRPNRNVNIEIVRLFIALNIFMNLFLNI